MEILTMPAAELWDIIDECFAHDTGMGIPDPSRRNRAIGYLRSMSLDAVRLFVCRWAREAFLSEEALALNYGLADIADFCQWFEKFHYEAMNPNFIED